MLDGCMGLVWWLIWIGLMANMDWFDGCMGLVTAIWIHGVYSDLSPPVGHPKWWFRIRESPQKPLNSGLGIIVICPGFWMLMLTWAPFLLTILDILELFPVGDRNPRGPFLCPTLTGGMVCNIELCISFLKHSTKYYDIVLRAGEFTRFTLYAWCWLFVVILYIYIYCDRSARGELDAIAHAQVLSQTSINSCCSNFFA